MMVDLHYLVTVVPTLDLPSLPPSLLPGGGALPLGAGKQLHLGRLPPSWGVSRPSPLTGGGLRRVLGPWTLGVVRGGFYPFPL